MIPEGMHATLSDERKDAIQAALRSFWRERFDEELSAYRSERLIEFFLGAPQRLFFVTQVIRRHKLFFVRKRRSLLSEDRFEIRNAPIVLRGRLWPLRRKRTTRLLQPFEIAAGEGGNQRIGD